MSKELQASEHPSLGFLRARELFARRANRAGHQRGISASVPPPVLVISSILSVQLGAAVAKSLFQSIGSSGTVFLRMGFAALILLLFWRPRLREYRRADYLLVLLFGLTVAAMNASFYAAIARIPLGIATTLEFVGPLGVAIAASRRRRDLLWVGLAAAGVALLAPIGKSTLDPLGIVFALLAGAGWATYILLNVRIGRAFTGGNGLALSMGVAALVFSPFGVTSGGGMLLNPNILLVGVGVAVLSTVIPFSLELEALRRLPARVFGVLMSLEPAIAALIGFLVLREAIQVRGLIALTLIMAASAGVSFFQEREEMH
jgi:inner membrane transporter RhtA